MSKEKKSQVRLLMEECFKENTTLEKNMILTIKALDLDPIDGEFEAQEKGNRNHIEQSVIKSFRENDVDISVLKPLILEGSASAFKILMTLVAEGYDEANEFAMALRDDPTTPEWLNDKIDEEGQRIADAQRAAEAEETKASDTATSKANKPEVVKATTNNHVDEHPPVVDNGCSCIVSYMTEIVYDNPALNQKDGSSSWGKGLFSFVDKFNFDPKALIRAERELEHTYSAGAV
jgi:hypothetical protein